MKSVVDLYGASGFDAICITDHLVDSQFWQQFPQALAIAPDNFRPLLGNKYRKRPARPGNNTAITLIPGGEVTNQTMGYHILAVDIKRFIDPDNSVEGIIEQIRIKSGRHRHRLPPPSQRVPERPPRPRFPLPWQHHEQYASLFDAWEAANREDDLFNAVSLKKYKSILPTATSTPKITFTSGKLWLNAPRTPRQSNKPSKTT